MEHQVAAAPAAVVYCRFAAHHGAHAERPSCVEPVVAHEADQ